MGRLSTTECTYLPYLLSWLSLLLDDWISIMGFIIIMRI